MRLLDDETPEVRKRVTERLTLCSGDLSEWLATRQRSLSSRENTVLKEILKQPRREILVREWVAPTGGAAALQEDWESFEALLRTLSDFLHDGVSLRQPLSDALDLLAEEASESGVTTANELREFLFHEGRLVGNQKDYYDPRNSDLAWCISENRSNPLGLCLIFMFVGRRLDLEIEGVNFPGHFMCRIFEEGCPLMIDCFDQGRLHLQETLLENPELTQIQRNILRQAVDPGAILLRLLNNLHQSFQKATCHEDAQLVMQLKATLE
jgi:regulator of sirC expression with transglutaminase-like and TPR domain